eukprot:TRINITY_DN80_c0_g1_i1.p1 TRINITY_DN80_c0_g1~~TRINITY_DN80_c0_g1_i1.p1  ORF type:complete len:729 (-),score=192.00 TRINITY_DN80_c0_g1_i1:200-2386(-)
MAVTPSDVVRFSVGGKIFTVTVPNLRLSCHPEAVLSKIVLDGDIGDAPVPVDADPVIFACILEMHKKHGTFGRAEKISLPPGVSRGMMMEEAKRFGLKTSAENFVEASAERGSAGYADRRGKQAAKVFDAWSPEEVRDWLKALQQGRFANYAERFYAEGMDGVALGSLTQEHLKQLGMNHPTTGTALLAALENAWAEDTSGLAMEAEQELQRAAEQRDRECSSAPEEDESAKAIDAAAMVLQSIFGKSGSREPFEALISEFRKEHPPINYETLGGDVPESPAAGAANGIRVAARVRPVLMDGPDAAAVTLGDFEAITVPAASDGNNDRRVVVHLCGMQRDGTNPKSDNKSFRVHSSVAPTADEDRVFDVARPVIDVAFRHATHTTILCYGQTGSGKTHTVGCLTERTCRHLFDVLGAQKVVLEAFEVRGGAKGLVMRSSHAFSLHSDEKPELALLEGKDGAVHVGGSSGVFQEAGQPLDLSHCSLASSSEELLRLFTQASLRRASGDTRRNAASSRSHAFYRFYMAEPMDGAGDGVVSGTGACVELVDLAGSESNKDALYHDKTLIDERAKINASLGALNTCIQKQAQGSSFVPYRSDKLTQLLRPCFDKRASALGSAPTVLFVACLSPLASDAQQSIRTLTYTQQLMGTTAKPARSVRQNKFLQEGLKQLAAAIEKGDIHSLREAIRIAQHNGVTGPERRKALDMLTKLEALEQGGEPVLAETAGGA